MKPILFIDFDGTICHDRFWRGLPAAQYSQMQSFLFGNDLTYVNEWMRGKRTSEEINDLVANKLGIPSEESWKVFVTDCETMYVSPEVLERIQSLRNKYTTILITGNMDCFMRFTVPALKLENYFDLISSSYDERMSKDDNGGEIFKKYVDKYGVRIEDCFAIDDSIKVIEVFKNLGGTAHLISKEKDVSYYLGGL